MIKKNGVKQNIGNLKGISRISNFINRLCEQMPDVQSCMEKRTKLVFFKNVSNCQNMTNLKLSTENLVF